MLTRYFLIFIIKHALALVGVLFFLRLVGRLSQVLEIVFAGDIALESALLSLGYASPQFLNSILPIGFVIGTVVGLGRLWQSGELFSAVLAGYRFQKLVALLVLTAVLVSACQWVLSVFVTPQTDCVAKQVWRSARAKNTELKVAPFVVQDIADWQVSITAKDQATLINPVLIQTENTGHFQYIRSDTLAIVPCSNKAECSFAMQLSGNVLWQSVTPTRTLRLQVANLKMGGVAPIHQTETLASCRLTARNVAYQPQTVLNVLTTIGLLLVLLPFGMQRRHASTILPYGSTIIISLTASGMVKFSAEYGVATVAVVQLLVFASCLLAALKWKWKSGNGVPLFTS